MSRGGSRKTRAGTPRDREAVKQDYDEAVHRLQRTAYRNLRTRIANVSIVIGVLALATIAFGAADGARLLPTLACAIAGVFGAGVYFTRPYPPLTTWFLIPSAVLTVVGIVALIAVVQFAG